MVERVKALPVQYYWVYRSGFESDLDECSGDVMAKRVGAKPTQFQRT